MNKKVIFLIVAFVLLLGIGGVFLLLGGEEDSLVEEIKFEEAGNYVIKDTPDGKFVENKNAGLSFKVPEGWEAEVKEYDKKEGGIEIFSQDANIDPNTNFPQKGCGIGVSIQYGEEKYQNIIKLIEETNEKYEVININNHQALKEIIFDNLKIGYGVSLQIPIKNGIYVFNAVFAPAEKEKCEQELESFLKTISIE